MPAPRRRPGPRTDANVLHCIGDTHFGSLTNTAFTRRYNVVKADCHRLATPEHRLQLGDLTENGAHTTTENPTGVAWMDSLGGQRLHVVGNHDMYTPGAGPPYPYRTADAAAAEWGLPAANHVVDLGYADLIIVAPDAVDTTFLTGCHYDTTAQAFLDASLTASTKDVCLIAAHAPLKDTVGFGAASPYRSTDQYFYAATDAGFTTDADLRAVIADHVKAKAWISGHTHSVVESPRLVYGETVGGHTLVNINTSCLAYTGNVKEWTDRLVTMFVEVDDAEISVHFRDHGAHQWVAGGPDRYKPWTVTL